MSAHRLRKSDYLQKSSDAEMVPFYVQDVWSRLLYLKARITSVYGKMLKID